MGSTTTPSRPLFYQEDRSNPIYGATHEEVRTNLNEIAKGLYIAPKKDTVGMWLKEWFVTYALPTVLWVRIWVKPFRL